MQTEQQVYDVVVIGSGGSGAAAAETAASKGARVLVISKDPLVCSDSKISEGIMTVRGSGSYKDSEQVLAANLLIQGDDLADPALAHRFAQDSATSYDWLCQQGIAAEIDHKTQQPKPLSIPMGGHSHARSVDHQNGGLDYGHACWNALNKSQAEGEGSIDYLEDAWFLDLYVVVDKQGAKRITGGLVYHATEGRFISLRASAVIIACGGLSTLYFPNTDTMKGNSGDSYAIAARAGAQLIDMEQVQFIPFAVTHPPAYRGLIVGEPLIAGVLGVIRDKDGKIVTSEIMGRTRAECSAAITQAVADGRGTENQGCYLDLTDNSVGLAGKKYTALMQEKIPSLLKTVRGAMGSKAARFELPWEVRPSAHYLMGGVRATEHCEALNNNGQKILGLFVAGQAMGGLHGSNRLGSTSLAEGIIFGRRAGNSAQHFVENSLEISALEFNTSEQKIINLYRAFQGEVNSIQPLHITRKLQQSAWRGIGPGREASGIQQVLNDIELLQQEMNQVSVGRELLWNQRLIDLLECRNMLLCAEMISLSALKRQRSLGAHVRLDVNKRTSADPHASIGCHISDCSEGIFENSPNSQPMDKISLSYISRPKSSVLNKTMLSVRQNGKILLFKAIRKLPFSIRDKVLLRAYSKAMGSEVKIQ